MDGYSVKDAAIVLGIPERRVWELLARGVLAGAPEGPDGMIVFLQPRSATHASPSGAAARAGAEAAGPRVNGNGGGQELSPFRELLTEFRNLTERYGQALLALGEARGEVAALRGRVELLEARMDLRLPDSRPTSTVAWELPDAVPEREEQESGAAAIEADAHGQNGAAVAELEETVAGEDEPAPEPMIDLVDEAVFAEAMARNAPMPEAVAAEMAETQAVVSDAAEPEASEPDVLEPVDIEPVATDPVGGEPQGDSPEPTAAAAPPESVDEEPELPEPPRRRTRGGRTATAAFAAALARADDPTIAELPGAEETAAALTALQRDIDASRAEPPPIVEAEQDAAPVAREREEVATVDAFAEESVTEASTQPTEPHVEADEVVQAPAAEPPPEVEQPPGQAPVPSYYSTDVVEPDWFADGDFSWLEAAQAEAARTEGAPEAAQVEAAHATEGEAEEPQTDEGGDADLGAVAIDIVEGAPGVAAELAFGDHPSAEATAPDLGHEGFEPSAESQAMAEEEARAAIQEAFEEAPAAFDEPSVAGLGGGAASATAVAEPEIATEQFEEPEVEEPAEASAEDVPVEEELIEETGLDEPMLETAILEASGEAAAIQEGFEPPTDVTHEQTAAEHEGEVEAEAIQEAFEEPKPAPAWSPLTPVPEPAADLADDARSPADDSPPTTVAAADDAWRGPEEFIAPPPQAVAGTAVTGPAGEQPAAAPGEEELMWLGDEFEEADLEVAAQGWRSPDTAPKPAGATPTLELSDAELAQLAEDEGWDPDEVEAIRRLLGRPSDAPPELPVQPAVDIRRPETRLDAQPEGPRPTDRPPTPPAGPTSAEPSGPETSSPPQGTGIVDDPDWLEDRGGTAAEAYRRLRKLFPG